MKHLLLTVATAALLAWPASAQLHSTVGKTPANPRSYNLEIAPAFRQMTTPASRSAGNVTIKPVLSDGITFVLASTVVDGKIVAYGDEVRSGKDFTLELPAGTYDMLGFGYTEDLMGTYLISLPGVELAEGSAPVFNTDEATTRIDFKYLSPSGKAMALSTEDGTVEGNCDKGDAMNLIAYKGEFLFYGDVTLFFQGQTYLLTNFTQSNYELTRLQGMASDEGFVQLVMPVDFTKSEVTNNVADWQLASVDIAKTPKNELYDNLMIEMGADPETDTYSWGQYAITIDGEFFGALGLGIEGKKYAPTTIGVNIPAGYTGPYDFILYPTGPALSGAENTIFGMPLRGSSEGLVQLGLNPAKDWLFMFGADAETFDLGNPNLPTAVPTDKLANCTPTLSTYPFFLPVEYSYTGRHGEVLTIDSWNMAEDIDPEYLDMFGEPTNIVSVYWGDKSIGDIHGDIDWDLGGDNDYRINFYMGNVAIDGNIKGHNHGVVTFNSETYKGKLPTVTLLQVFDNEGNPTDRLTDPEGASVGIYATGLELCLNEEFYYNYFNYTKPASVKVEYAPYTGTDFKELTVVADPSKDWTPGWGSYYTAELSEVKEHAPYGWYSLRITVTTEEGAVQQQLISPAFNIAGFADIEAVGNTDAEAPVVYYNLQGQRVDNPAAGQLVIRRQGTKATKIIL